MSDASDDAAAPDEVDVTVGFVVAQGLLLLVLQVVTARLWPFSDPLLATAPWLLVALGHGLWGRTRMPSAAHFVAVGLAALVGGGLEAVLHLEDPHGLAAHVAVGLDVTLYTGLVGGVGVWTGRALARR